MLYRAYINRHARLDRVNNSGYIGFSMKICKQLEKLSQEHHDCILFSEIIAKIANGGGDAELAKGVELVKEYNKTELEVHLQHEERTIFSPLIQEHKKHVDLCISLGKEHGYMRSLVEEITLETAKKDLADFAVILKNHTLKEDQELFPLLESLFTEEELDAVMNFVPFRRQEISASRPELKKQSNKEASQEWLQRVQQYYLNLGKTGGSIVLFPGYRPDLCIKLADQLGLEFFDYQKDEMQKLGLKAESIGLDELNNSLRAKAEKTGIFSHNIEALLCVKSESERRAWLDSFLETEWPNPIFLPISIYQADVPEEHQRVCDLELLRMPKPSFPIDSKSDNRLKYNLKTMRKST